MNHWEILPQKFCDLLCSGLRKNARNVYELNQKKAISLWFFYTAMPYASSSIENLFGALLVTLFCPQTLLKKNLA
jgi:hypothetical protein